MIIKVIVILPPALVSPANTIKAIAVQSAIAVWGRRSGYDSGHTESQEIVGNHKASGEIRRNHGKSKYLLRWRISGAADLQWRMLPY